MIRTYFWAAAAFLASAAMGVADPSGYTQTNLTSDLPGVAANLDPNLVNPWGLAASPTSPFWTSDNGSGLSTIYNGHGVALGLVVTIPAAAGKTPPADPTGVVFNNGAGAGNFNGSPFLFDTESGTIVAWKGGTTAAIAATGDAGSVYKGLALNSSGSLLYAANFGLGRVDVYNSTFGATSVSGGFVDPTLPTGYSPFNIRNIDGNLYVTFASGQGHDETDGAGLGFVDEFDSNGNLIKRIASQGALDAPWGLALAPSGFGALSGDLLVGNFGDGLINAFDPTTGMFQGTLDDSNGNPLVNQGLWGISFGNGSQNEGVDTLYFNAGIPGPGNVEDHGLFGAIDVATPEPGPVSLSLIGAGVMLAGVVRRRISRRA
jgi:uncharacterized protein (TIGR03118 family)